MSRPRVLWLHGFLGCGADADGLFPGCEVLAPDLVDQPFEALAQLARGVDWLAGYSMGGRIALQLAASNRFHLKGMIIESASPGIAESSARSQRLELDESRARSLERQGTRSFLETWYAAPFWDSLSGEQKCELIEQKAHRDAAELATMLRTYSVGHQPDLSDWVDSCTCPLLWLAGANDPAYAATARERKLSAGRVALIPGAGHNIHFEQPEAFRRIVADFMNIEQESI